MSRATAAGAVARPVLAAGVAALTTVLVLLGGSSAQAHNGLRSTTPSDGEQVSAPPTAVTLEFDQPALAVGTAVVVTAADGTVVSEGDPVLVDAAVTQTVSGLSAGDYEVVWRATSADGHPVSGAFSFGVAAGVPPTSSAPPPTSPPSDPAAEATGSPTAPNPLSPAAEEESTAAAAAASAADGSGGSGVGGLVAVGAVVLALLGGGVVASRRRRSPHGPPGQS